MENTTKSDQTTGKTLVGRSPTSSEVGLRPTSKTPRQFFTSGQKLKSDGDDWTVKSRALPHSFDRKGRYDWAGHFYQ